jgi:hypothetical protein
MAMIKILSELKQNNRKLYNKVEQELERFGGYSNKGHFNRLSYPDYLDLISFSESYSFQPSEYEMVMNVLSDLNPIENETMSKVKSCQPKDKKALMELIRKQNNRCRQRTLKLVADLTADKPSFLKSLQAVFS